MDELIFKTILLKGEAGNNISNIQKTATSGNVDTYTITLTDGSTTTFDVTNGNGIENIEKTATSGLVDTYTITFTDGSTTTFDVTNGNSVDTDALKEEIYKEMYPVGHVVISFNSTNPAKYGTVWERTGEGRMLLGVSDEYEVEDTGGEATHTLNMDEMPNHDHLGSTESERYRNLSDGAINWGVCYATASPTIANNQGIGRGYAPDPYIAASNDGVHHTHPIAAQGGSQPHNNMPPYIAVYMWRRVS